MQGPHAMCGACVGSASSRPERCWQDAAALQRWTYRRRMQRGAQRAPWCLVRRELVASRAEFARARSEARVHGCTHGMRASGRRHGGRGGGVRETRRPSDPGELARAAQRKGRPG
eukprot:COSAG03_NODE_700_length_6205_cov_3.689977_4_plen_115_part_00